MSNSIIMYFIGLIVRCKNEPYVSEFVNYYINQGIDKIYIIDDDSDNNTYREVFKNEKVNIIYGINKDIIDGKTINVINTTAIKKIYREIKNDYEWIINVDMDEYITTKKNIKKTIREELESTFKGATCIKIPWVMMSCNSLLKNPMSLLKTNIYRWNHDKKHKNCSINKFRCRYDKIEVKCIFRPKYFDDIELHHPKNPNCDNIKIVEGIGNSISILNSYHDNLREYDIEFGYLLCYHYRITSIENCLNKIKYNLMYKNYTLNNLLSNDCPEVIDETLKYK